MRVLTIGAGVIGQAYAGRLAAAGHDVTVLARGDRAALLQERGLRLAGRDGTRTHRVDVATTVSAAGGYDWALVACRFDQLDTVRPLVADADARTVTTLCNLPHGGDPLLEQAVPGRLTLGFPGIGGHLDDDGVVHHTVIRRQHTTIGRADGLEDPVVDALRAAGFAVDVEDDMPAWLTTHAVFICTVGAAVLAAGGDSRDLGRDRAGTSRMVRAVGDAFTSLKEQGITPVPAPLRTIFTSVPRPIAVPYWQRQLRGAVGTETIAPHVRATRHTELPALAAAVRETLGPAPQRWDELLREAGL